MEDVQTHNANILHERLAFTCLARVRSLAVAAAERRVRTGGAARCLAEALWGTSGSCIIATRGHRVEQGPVPRRLGHDAGSPRLSFQSSGIRGHGVNMALAGATGHGVFVLFDTASRGRVFGAF